MKQESTQATSVNALNRAKMYQLVLFPMNNGATNVYYILTMNFIAYYANGVLAGVCNYNGNIDACRRCVH